MSWPTVERLWSFLLLLFSFLNSLLFWKQFILNSNNYDQSKHVFDEPEYERRVIHHSAIDQYNPHAESNEEESNEDLSDIASIPSITITNENEYFQWVKNQNSTINSSSTKQFSCDSYINKSSESDLLNVETASSQQQTKPFTNSDWRFDAKQFERADRGYDNVEMCSQSNLFVFFLVNDGIKGPSYPKNKISSSFQLNIWSSPLNKSKSNFDHENGILRFWLFLWDTRVHFFRYNEN